jgi:hypothetical protein
MRMHGENTERQRRSTAGAERCLMWPVLEINNQVVSKLDNSKADYTGPVN